MVMTVMVVMVNVVRHAGGGQHGYGVRVPRMVVMRARMSVAVSGGARRGGRGLRLWRRKRLLLLLVRFPVAEHGAREFIT